MELSTDIENLHDFNKLQKNIGQEDCSSMHDSSEILDLSTLNLDNEETWLYKPEHVSTSINTQDWLYGKCDIPTTSELPPDFIVPKLKSSKTIDTRTFTRPKKKFIRPSINDYEQLYLSSSDGTDMNSSVEKNHSPKWPQTVKEEQESSAGVPAPAQPLQFDLSQPTSLHNFDSFMINSADVDSFQNMSPPSLVNSLCSSTFANLMDSSFIKNDPVLREIRDKDFTETALLQDTEAPMFQSITESCSSLNSDSPESFLKKMSFNGTFKRNVSDSNTTIILQEKSSNNSTENSVGNNATFEVQNVTAGSNTDNKNSTYPIDTTPQSQSTEGTHHSIKSNQSSLGSLNGTYRRTPKANGTFRKSDLKNNRLSLNLTYEMPKEIHLLERDLSKSIENDMNNSNKGNTKGSKSRAVILRSDSIENLKKRYSAADLNMDLNRLSYCMEEQDNQINTTYKEEKVNSELHRTVEIKRSSLGSADSLDRMSSLSSSSKGSTKVLSMEDVEAIVEMQERSLSQAMSTPKPSGGPKKLWENNFISPIVADAKDRLSDSELSDDYKSVKSQMSSKASLETWKKPSAKSLGYLVASNNDLKLKTTQKSSYAPPSQRPLQALPSKMRGSYSNISTLKTTSSTIGGSHSNLFRPSSNTLRPPSSSNLKSMGTKLKGSYTSLRPISANLPVVPPIGSTLSNTHTVLRRSAVNVTRTADPVRMELPPAPKEKVPPLPTESTFVKPQNLRTSGLPRPTGIPRPASRIPGPRSSNIRPSFSRNMNY